MGDSGRPGAYPERERRRLLARVMRLRERVIARDPTAATVFEHSRRWQTLTPEEDAAVSPASARDLGEIHRLLRQAGALVADWENSAFTLASGLPAADPVTPEFTGTALSPRSVATRWRWTHDDPTTLDMCARLRAGADPAGVPGVAAVDAMVAESRTVRPIVVWRGLWWPGRPLARGDVLTDPAWPNGDLSRAQAEVYLIFRAATHSDHRRPTLLRLAVPAGTPCVLIGFGEVLLPRNCTISVRAAKPGPARLWPGAESDVVSAAQWSERQSLTLVVADLAPPSS